MNASNQSTTLDVGGVFSGDHLSLVSVEDTVVVLGAGAAANSVYFRWLEHHSRLLERNGRLGEVRHAADTPVGIAGRQSWMLDIPALCWIHIFQRYCVRVPWRHWVGNWISHGIC